MMVIRRGSCLLSFLLDSQYHVDQTLAYYLTEDLLRLAFEAEVIVSVWGRLIAYFDYKKG